MFLQKMRQLFNMKYISILATFTVHYLPDGRIQTRVAATAARCATNALHTSLMNYDILTFIFLYFSLCPEIVQYSIHPITQWLCLYSEFSTRRDVRFKPGTIALVVWSATNEPPQLHLWIIKFKFLIFITIPHIKSLPFRWWRTVGGMWLCAWQSAEPSPRHHLHHLRMRQTAGNRRRMRKRRMRRTAGRTCWRARPTPSSSLLAAVSPRMWAPCHPGSTNRQQHSVDQCRLFSYDVLQDWNALVLVMKDLKK